MHDLDTCAHIALSWRLDAPTVYMKSVDAVRLITSGGALTIPDHAARICFTFRTGYTLHTIIRRRDGTPIVGALIASARVREGRRVA